jgi:hypothetical protein
VEQPVVDGIRLLLYNETNVRAAATSKWNNTAVRAFTWFQWVSNSAIGQLFPNDYMVVFGPLGIDTSLAVKITSSFTTRAIPINFKVYNAYDNKPVKVAFGERDLTGGAGIMSVAYDTSFVGSSRSDVAVISETSAAGKQVLTWAFGLMFDSTKADPTTGDTLYVQTTKLFRGRDVFEFTTRAQTVDPSLAKAQLDLIRVVPNPYIAAATWEGANPFSNGRGPRSIHFTHLPQHCTIRIYTVSGELVTTIDHESTMLDGRAEWNLLTRDNLAASYGIYIYHVDAPGIGEKVGKFAVIK